MTHRLALNTGLMNISNLRQISLTSAPCIVFTTKTVFDIGVKYQAQIQAHEYKPTPSNTS